MSKKPRLTRRQPRRRTDPVAAQSWIEGPVGPRTQRASTDVRKRPARQVRNGRVERQGGDVRRRMTVYLPPKLADRLVDWCKDHGRQISHAATEAIRLWMKGRKS